MRRIGAITFVLGMVALAALIIYAGAASIGDALLALGAGGIAIVGLLHIAVIVLLGQAWWSIGRDIPGATTLKFVWARLVRDSAAEVLPFSQVGGYVLGARVLRLSGLPLSPVGISMIVDLLAEFAAMLPYTTAGLLVLAYLSPSSGLYRPLAVGLVATAMGLTIVLVYRTPLKSMLERAAMALATRWPSLGLSDRHEMRSAFDRAFAKDKRVLFGFAVHVVCWVVGAIETWVIFALMNVHIGPLEAIVIDSVVSALRTFAFMVPASVGVQEAAYVLVCAAFAVSPAQAVAFSLARRARDLAIGILGLAAWQCLEGKRAFAWAGQKRNGR